jgi:hypothetical protein
MVSEGLLVPLFLDPNANSSYDSLYWARLIGAGAIEATCGGILVAWVYRVKVVRRASQALPPTQCLSCGYDLRDMTGASCPECGALHPSMDGAAAPAPPKIASVLGAVSLLLGCATLVPLLRPSAVFVALLLASTGFVLGAVSLLIGMRQGRPIALAPASGCLLTSLEAIFLVAKVGQLA